VTRLLTDAALYEAKSAEAREYSDLWTASRMAHRVETLYEQVLKDYKPR